MKRREEKNVTEISGFRKKMNTNIIAIRIIVNESISLANSDGLGGVTQCAK